jgi:hypothetical protein
LAIRLTAHEQKVYEYLKSISPSGATNAEIVEVTQIQPHQQVFQITQRLRKLGLIQGEQGRFREKEWVFFCPAERLVEQEKQDPIDHAASKPKAILLPQASRKTKLSPLEFERLATEVMSRCFGLTLGHARLPGVPKDFDLVSADGSTIGDAKYFTLVAGERLPPAKFSVIAEHVWLLEKTPAKRKFLVFGNQRDVPVQWLKRYGHMVQGIEFYFLSDDGELERLKG